MILKSLRHFRLTTDRGAIFVPNGIGFKRMILRKKYGDKIESAFNLTRQGVRWRFRRLFNEIYVSAYECIYVVESLFGTDLRHKAMEIARERVDLRKKAQNIGNQRHYRRKDS